MFSFRMFAVAAAGNSVWNSDGQKVRYDNHAVHRAEHAHDDVGPLSAERDVQQCSGLSQHDIHCDIHQRVSHEDLRSSLPLFQGAMESLWFCCCYIVNIR